MHALRRFGLHLALFALAALQLAAHAVHRPGDAEARALAFDASLPAKERIAAIHRVANRATERDPELGEALARELLASADRLLREYALTIDLCKHHPGAAAGQAPPLQAEYAIRHPGRPGTAHHLRSVLLYRRKVGGEGVGGMWRLVRDEVRWFTDTLAGRPLPPPETLSEHFRARAEEGELVLRKRREIPVR